MRFLATFMIVAILGVALGGATAWYTVRQTHSIGAVNLGPWTAFVHDSAENTDPYLVARSVAEGTVPIGATEGLAFEALTDSQGQPLSRRCRYRIEGTTPPARLWTLVAYGEAGRQLAAMPGGVSALHSMRLLRFPDGSFLIHLSPEPMAGNWMSVAGTGPMRLVLRLYDTPITASAGLAPPSMPSIERRECSA